MTEIGIAIGKGASGAGIVFTKGALNYLADQAVDEAIRNPGTEVVEPKHLQIALAQVVSHANEFMHPDGIVYRHTLTRVFRKHVCPRPWC